MLSGFLSVQGGVGSYTEILSVETERKNLVCKSDSMIVA